MADIFMSYSRVDLPRARQFEQALEQCGWSVFWDRELLPGEGYRRAIEHELKQARCVIVLWSRASVESEWVIDEAESGKQNGRLVSVRIDDVEMPLGFRQLHAATLVEGLADWIRWFNYEPSPSAPSRGPAAPTTTTATARRGLSSTTW